MSKMSSCFVHKKPPDAQIHTENTWIPRLGFLNSMQPYVSYVCGVLLCIMVCFSPSFCFFSFQAVCPSSGLTVLFGSFSLTLVHLLIHLLSSCSCSHLITHVIKGGEGKGKGREGKWRQHKPKRGYKRHKKATKNNKRKQHKRKQHRREQKATEEEAS